MTEEEAKAGWEKSIQKTYTRITKNVYDDAYTVRLVVGKQSFRLAYEAEDRGKATHMAAMLSKALYNLVQEETGQNV